MRAGAGAGRSAVRQQTSPVVCMWSWRPPFRALILCLAAAVQGALVVLAS